MAYNSTLVLRNLNENVLSTYRKKTVKDRFFPVIFQIKRLTLKK